jgi:spermidine synthase
LLEELRNAKDNGLLSANFPDPPAYEALAHWPLLAHPSPRRVLIIGGAVTGSLSELLKHPVEQIDYVELDPALIRLVEHTLPAEDRTALTDPRVHLLHVDGRRWLATTTQAYDVILLQLPEPRNAQVNRLYTLEAFRLIHRHLVPHGLFAFTVSSSENYLSEETAYFNASLYQTLRAAFPSVDLVAGDPLLFLAGTDEVRLDPQTLAARYAQRGLITREVVPPAFPILLDAARRDMMVERLSSVRASILNRDFIPVCYAYAWRVWISKFVSPLYFLSMLVFIALLFFGARILWRRRALLTSRPGATAVCALGTAGMAYETIVLLAFQSIHGYLYWQLGSLFAAFMLGLALGSWGASRWLSAAPTSSVPRWLRSLLVAAAIEGVALVAFLPVAQHLTLRVPGVLVFGAWLLLTGVWLGCAFPLAGRLAPAEESDTSATAGLLYAADLWGAACGALVTSAVLVPLIGFLPTLAMTSLFLLIVSFLYIQIPGIRVPS